MSRSVSTVGDGGHEPEKAAQRPTSVQVDAPCTGEDICPASARWDARQHV